ncbi:MAG: DNA-binding response OmpR family regulator, partial [Candidatus Latescibacterota bacterium]
MEEEKSLILIVDDNPENVRLLGMLIKDEGYLVGIARDGEQALEMAAQQRPDLVLLDVMMPGMDGFAVCARLKEQAETCAIPVILLTARVESEDIIKGFESGAVDYVTKPFNTPELLARVRTQLDLQQAMHKLVRAYDEPKALQDKLLEAERT